MKAWVVLPVALALIGTGAFFMVRHKPGPVTPEVLTLPGEAGPHVTVEVLNTIGVDGLAAKVTARLRHGGLDVVSFGSGGGDARTTTEILVRRGDSTAGVRVRDVLGVGRVRMAPDASLLLDVSVLVGADAVPLKIHP